MTVLFVPCSPSFMRRTKSARERERECARGRDSEREREGGKETGRVRASESERAIPGQARPGQ